MGVGRFLIWIWVFRVFFVFRGGDIGLVGEGGGERVVLSRGLRVLGGVEEF